MDVDAVKISKRLTQVLRHDPGSVGLTMDEAGWVDVDALLTALAAHGAALSRTEFDYVVATSDKQRFAFDATGTRVRASQGHSRPVDLGYSPQTPPPVLFHGTPVRNLAAIRRQGLRAGRRHAVHLSPDEETAGAVGRRRGEYVVLRVDARALAASGASLTCSANGVWLVDSVPPEYLSVLPVGPH